MTIPRLKIKAPVPFPANVAATGGIAVSKSNGTWIIEPDFTQLAIILGSSVADPTTKEVWIFDPVSGEYNVITLAGLGDALYKLTSTTSLAIGAGSKTFTTQSGKDVGVGSWILATSNADPANFISGQVTAYTGTALTINVTAIGGSGTKADWTMRASASPGTQGRSSGFSYDWLTDLTATDPGAGNVKADNAVFASIANLRISKIDHDGNALAAELSSWASSTSTVKGRIKIYDPLAPVDFFTFDVLSVTDNSTYDTVAVTPVTSGGAFTNLNAVRVEFFPKGSKGDTGATGPNGTNGLNPGLTYTFDTTTTMAAPAMGAMRLNNATIASATAIAFNSLTADTGNPSAETFISHWGDSTTSAHRGQIILRKLTAPGTYAIFDITAAVADNTTWLQLTVAFLNGSGTFSASDALIATWVRTGDSGTGAVSSFNARAGAVLPVSGDYTYAANTVALPRGYWSGLNHSNDGTTPDTKVDIAAGVARDSTDAINIVCSSGVIDLSVNGAVNCLDTGTLAASTWYYTFAIAQNSGTSGFLASLSPTAPTLPTGYTKFRRIGSFVTDGTSHVVPFTHVNDEWWFNTPVASVTLSTLGNSSTLITLPVPRIKGVIAIINALMFDSSTASIGVVIQPGFLAGTSVSVGGFSLHQEVLGSGAGVHFRMPVDSSGRIRATSDAAGATTNLTVYPQGYRDPL